MMALFSLFMIIIMNQIKVQNLLENLINLSLPEAKQERKTILLSLFNRILGHNFPDEFSNLQGAFMQMAGNSSTQSPKVVEVV